MFQSKQLSLPDIYAHCLDAFDNDKPEFLSLLEQNNRHRFAHLPFLHRLATGKHLFAFSLLMFRNYLMIIYNYPTDVLIFLALFLPSIFT